MRSRSSGTGTRSKRSGARHLVTGAREPKPLRRRGTGARDPRFRLKVRSIMSQPNIPHCDCIGTSDEDSFCMSSYLRDLQDAIASETHEPSAFELRRVDL
jgi:hypothetical protein